MDPFQNTLVSVAVQATGVLVVAGLLRPLARLTPGRFLTYWWQAWAVLAAALGLLYAAQSAAGPLRPVLLAGYLLADYLFAFLVWAGCRDLSEGVPLVASDWAWFVPFAGFALFAPAASPDLPDFFPAHAVLVGFLFLESLRALGRASGGGPGLWLTRVSLAGLIVLFWNFAVSVAVIGYLSPDGVNPYMGFWTLYDLLFETGLAFGMVVLASDRVRAELETRNAQLAAMAADLTRAATSDPLTGLLNRRALADLVADPPARPFAGVLAVLDLNDLKPLNDRDGHLAGDAALQTVARALRNLFRVTDPVFRIGGDEFLALLPGGTVADLEDRLRALDLALIGQRLPGVAEPVDLRVAWGVAEFVDAPEVWAAVAKADAAMYGAKSAEKRRQKGW